MAYKRVLIVDDEKELHVILEEAFKGKGLMLECFTNAGFAQGKLDKETYAAIISDIKMPIVDGFQFVKSVRSSKLNKRTPVFFISGFLDKDALMRAKGLGVNGVFVKPLDLTSIVGKVVEATNQ